MISSNFSIFCWQQIFESKGCHGIVQKNLVASATYSSSPFFNTEFSYIIVKNISILTSFPRFFFCYLVYGLLHKYFCEYLIRKPVIKNIKCQRNLHINTATSDLFRHCTCHLVILHLKSERNCFTGEIY